MVDSNTLVVCGAILAPEVGKIGQWGGHGCGGDLMSESESTQLTKQPVKNMSISQ